jgi:hypothetical protein
VDGFCCESLVMNEKPTTPEPPFSSLLVDQNRNCPHRGSTLESTRLAQFLSLCRLRVFIKWRRIEEAGDDKGRLSYLCTRSGEHWVTMALGVCLPAAVVAMEYQSNSLMGCAALRPCSARYLQSWVHEVKVTYCQCWVGCTLSLVPWSHQRVK